MFLCSAIYATLLFYSVSASPPPSTACVPSSTYSIVIDAGSAGTRVSIFNFTRCLDGDPISQGRYPHLLNEIYDEVEPGLSAYKNNPLQAPKSIEPLLHRAKLSIPPELHSVTPVVLKATAGLRLLNPSQTTDILQAVESSLREDWPFLVQEGAVSIIDGEEEGISAWLTGNYLIGTLDSNSSQTGTFLDLGGASTQFVFEPKPSPNQPLPQSEAIVEVNFAGKRQLYQHSYLGYGVYEARYSTEYRLVAEYASIHSIEWIALNASQIVANPCYNVNQSKEVAVMGDGRREVRITFAGSESAGTSCEEYVRRTFDKSALCNVEPCSFNGVYQPNITESFHGPIYLLGACPTTLEALDFGLDNSVFTFQQLHQLAKDVCSRSTGGWNRFSSSPSAISNLTADVTLCFDLTYMHSLFTYGYGFGHEREAITAKYIEGASVSWTLGAALRAL